MEVALETESAGVSRAYWAPSTLAGPVSAPPLQEAAAKAPSRVGHKQQKPIDPSRVGSPIKVRTFTAEAPAMTKQSPERSTIASWFFRFNGSLT